jgi:hypothetical protein
LAVDECCNSWELADVVLNAEALVDFVEIAYDINPFHVVGGADFLGFFEVKSFVCGVRASNWWEENVIDADFLYL